MTGAEWLTCKDPAEMFNALPDGVSARRLRLFACGCCRQIWHLLTEEDDRRRVEAAERCAEGLISESEMAKVVPVHWGQPIGGPASQAVRVTHYAPYQAARRARAFAIDAIRAAEGPEGRARLWQQQCHLLRELFTHCFVRVVLPPEWCTWHGGLVPGLVQAIHDEQAWDRLPILGDALEDLGCSEPSLLAHCREPGPHGRGCWVVEGLLGLVPPSSDLVASSAGAW
jgi:hypothetical protein